MTRLDKFTRTQQKSYKELDLYRQNQPPNPIDKIIGVKSNIQAPMTSLSLDEIATAIKTNIDVITSHLKTHDGPDPSLFSTGNTGCYEFPDGSDHAELQQAREQLMYHSLQLHDLMAGPSWMMTMFPLQVSLLLKQDL